MKPLLSRTTPDAREARRFRAYELHQSGWTQTAIAGALGVTQGAVSQWLKRAAAGGVEALRAKPVPGAPRHLSNEQLSTLPSLLEKGAEAFGFHGNRWTTGRIAVVMGQTWGVSHSPQHVGRLLQEIGWSRQKPQRRARQQDEAAVKRFREETGPALKRGR
jgi:transposase